ncbi:MAG: hypothetical protein HFH67_17125 [Lachnospiraceae bacterium]|nr:hypothetical protein [Lachnospiraceae bacterium]
MPQDEAARYEAYLTKDAQDMIIPGIKELDRIHLHYNSLKGIYEIQRRKAYYDDYDIKNGNERFKTLFAWV